MGMNNLALVPEGVSDFLLKKHMANKTRVTMYAVLHESVKSENQSSVQHVNPFETQGTQVFLSTV